MWSASEGVAGTPVQNPGVDDAGDTLSGIHMSTLTTCFFRAEIRQTDN